MLCRTVILAALLLIDSSFSFEIGKRYVYKYETKVFTTDGVERAGHLEPQAHYKLLCNVRLLPVWEKHEEKLTEITLDKPKLRISGKAKLRDANLDLPSTISPIYVHSVKGEIKNIFCSLEDDAVLKDMLKSIYSLLSQQEIPEFHGSCNTTHSTEEGSSKIIKKVCTNLYHPKRKVSYVRTVLVQRTIHEEYSFSSDDHPEAAVAEERLQMFSPLWKEESVSIHSQTQLNLKETGPGQSSMSGENVYQVIQTLNREKPETFVKENKFSTKETRPVKTRCNLETTVNNHKKHLNSKNIGNLTSTTGFTALLKCFRTAKKEEIIRVLKNKKFAKVLPQLLDAVAYSGTKAAIDAAFETLQFVDGDIEIINRFLLPFAMNIYPSKEMIAAVQSTLKKLSGYKESLINGKSRIKEEKLDANDEIEASLISALGGLARNLNYIGEQSDHELIEEVDSFLKQSIDECEKESCLITHLKAVRSMALPTSRDLLVNMSSAGGKVTFEALSSLKEMQFQNDPQCEKLCHQIFHQISKKHDAQNRILAAEMLMDCYSDVATLQQLLNELQNQREFEVKTYLASRIMNKMQESSKFRSNVLSVLRGAKHYYALAQKGDSVYFRNDAIPALSSLSEMSGVNGTYSVSILLSPQGFLNRHFSEGLLFTPGGNERLFSASCYSQGLSNFFSSAGNEEEEEDAADAEPMLSLDLVLYGVALPPVVFFKGVSDMMSRALSGGSSFPEIRGNYLVADFSDEARLRNGLPVHLRMQAVVSNVLQGALDISFWSQTSKTTITNKAALSLEASAAVETSFMGMASKASAGSEFQVDFVTNAEFYELPYSACTEALHADIHVKHVRSVSLKPPHNSLSYRKTKRKKWTLPAASYAIHQKNSAMCAAMASR